MKNLVFITLSILLITACGLKDAPEANVKSKGIELPNRMSSFALDNYSEFSDTFVTFFFPKEGTMNWKSDVFKKDDKEYIKLGKIKAKVIELSSKIDADDKLLKNSSDRYNQLENIAMDIDCSLDGDDGDFGDDDFDFGDDDFGDDDFDFEDDDFSDKSLQSKNTQCVKYQEEYQKLLTIIMTVPAKKAVNTANIQKAIERFDWVDDGEGGVKTKKGYSHSNWLEYGGDANLYQFDFSDLKNIKIVLPKLGNSIRKVTKKDGQIIEVEGNYYSTGTGEIKNARLVPAKYAGKAGVMMLKFTVKEKNSKGHYSGNIWKAELEQSSFLDKVRFVGDLKKYNKKGKYIQRGVMKFELAPKGEF